MKSKQQELKPSLPVQESEKKPYKTRYLLEVVPNQPLVLVDLGQYPPKTIKTYPHEQLEEAKKELFRLGEESRRLKLL